MELKTNFKYFFLILELVVTYSSQNSTSVKVLLTDPFKGINKQANHTRGAYTPGCVWINENKLECNIRTLEENFASWAINGDWDVMTENGSVGVRRYMDVRRVQVLHVNCNQKLLFQSTFSHKTFEGLNQIEELNLKDCKLSTLPSQATKRMSKLRRLIIISRNNEWPALNLDILSDSISSAVETINLSSNNIWNLPNGLFCHLESLIFLNISNNKLQTINKLDFLAEDETRNNNAWSMTKEIVQSSREILYNSSYSVENKYATKVTSFGCSSSLQTLVLNNNEINSIPAGGFSGLKELKALYLSHNHINVLSNQSFKKLDNLQLIDLSNNRISLLENGTFNRNTNLNKLLLRNNSIKTLSSDIFHGLGELQVLDMSFNFIKWKSGYEKLFQELRRLIILNLSYNLIERLDVALFRDLTSLQVLNLSHNKLKTIQTYTFSNMFNLYELDLSNNQISVLMESSLSGLVGLNILNLHNNSLSTILNKLLQQSSNLKTILVSNNNFKKIPTAIEKLSFLKEIDISGNNIHAVDQFSFYGLNLHVLNLSHNDIYNITNQSLINLDSLLVLDLKSNNISNIEEGSLNKLKNLKILNISQNKVSNINGLFAGMEALEELDISENLIIMFDYALLPRQLLHLNISHNTVTTIGNYFKVQKVLSLKKMDVSFNKIAQLTEMSVPNYIEIFIATNNIIKDINPGTFKEKLKLKLINLRMNRIAKLNPKAVSSNFTSSGHHNVIMLLGRNPLICDCEMGWLLEVSAPTSDSNERYKPEYSLPLIGDVTDVICSLPYSGGNRLTQEKIIDTTMNDYLCPYAAHCFALCHCCDFIACDCQMKCPPKCRCFHDDTWGINLVDCSAGKINRLPDKLPMDATVVFLDANYLKILHPYHFIGRHSIQRLYLNNSNVQILQNRTFHGLTSLQELHLENNMVVHLNGFEFSGLHHLQLLFLQNNKISFINSTTFTDLKTLEELRLDNNFIVQFPIWVLYQNSFLSKINLLNNPWSCNCIYLNDAIEWIKDNRNLVVQHREMFCVDDKQIFPRIFDSMFVCKAGQFGAQPYNISQYELPFVVGGLCTGVTLVAVIVIAAMFIVKRKVRSARKLGYSSNTFASEDEGKVFDAFVSYSMKDAAAVRSIASQLESLSPSYKLCLYLRDNPDSLSLSELISQSICFSKRIMIIISKNFVENEWLNTIFRRSHIHNLRGREGNIITLYIDNTPESDLEPDLKQIVKKSKRIKWKGKNSFKKICEHMPHKTLYSAYSVYLNDSIYKSVPFSFPRTSQIPSSSSVLTATTGLPTPDGGRGSIISEYPLPFKAPPPPRYQYSTAYVNMRTHESPLSPCEYYMHSQRSYPFEDFETASVHTYNSLDICSNYQRNAVHNGFLTQQPRPRPDRGLTEVNDLPHSLSTSPGRSVEEQDTLHDEPLYYNSNDIYIDQDITDPTSKTTTLNNKSGQDNFVISSSPSEECFV